MLHVLSLTHGTDSIAADGYDAVFQDLGCPGHPTRSAPTLFQWAYQHRQSGLVLLKHAVG
jgi:hypothetical protein